MQRDRIFAVVLRQYYLVRSSLARLIPMFAWAAVDVVLWGFITKFLSQHAAFNTPFIPFFLGAILLWNFLVRVMHGTTMAFMEDSWARNFFNMFASPLKISEYLLGLVMTGILTSLIGLTICGAIAATVFSLSMSSYGLLLIPFVFILFLTGVALGILGCILLLRLGPAAEWFVWPIPAALTPFACVFYPLATLPEWMQTISLLLPPAYVFEGMRGVLEHGRVDVVSLFTGFALAVLYIVIACWGFAKVYHVVVRSGLLARHSAESVN